MSQGMHHIIAMVLVHLTYRLILNKLPYIKEKNDARAKYFMEKLKRFL